MMRFASAEGSTYEALHDLAEKLRQTSFSILLGGASQDL